MRENVFFRYILPLLLILPIGFVMLYPQLLRCIRIGDSPDFRLLTGMNNVYVNRSATPFQQRQLHQYVVAARSRIRRFWGERHGQAILIYCPKQTDYEQYCAGGEGAGCSIGMPWGTSYLVLGPDGNNVDVIAHELCHDELFTRLGWWRVKRQIPQWFNEGLALLVDYRFSSPAIWEQPDSLIENPMPWNKSRTTSLPPRPMLTLRELETAQGFFGGDYVHTILAYQTSAEEVGRWLAVVGQAGIPALTNAIVAGDTFTDTYQRLERSKQTRPK